MSITEHGEGVVEFFSITQSVDQFGPTLAKYLQMNPQLEVTAMAPKIGPQPLGLKEIIGTVGYFVTFRQKIRV